MKYDQRKEHYSECNKKLRKVIMSDKSEYQEHNSSHTEACQ